MIRQERDPSLDALLDLDGEVMVVGDGPYWTKFVVKRVPASQERPHGLHYSLMLHNVARRPLAWFRQRQSGPGGVGTRRQR